MGRRQRALERGHSRHAACARLRGLLLRGRGGAGVGVREAVGGAELLAALGAADGRVEGLAALGARAVGEGGLGLAAGGDGALEGDVAVHAHVRVFAWGDRDGRGAEGAWRRLVRW